MCEYLTFCFSYDNIEHAVSAVFFILGRKAKIKIYMEGGGLIA
jgi:hypothetical protein